MEVVIGTAVGVAIGLLAGIPLSLLAQRYLAQSLRQRRHLGYEVFGPYGLIPKLDQLNPAMRLMVKQSVLDSGYDDPADSNFVEVDEVYGFWVEIKNLGNCELVKQPITLQFALGTKVIFADLARSPEFGDAVAEIDVDNSRSRVTVTLPFLNQKQGATVSIQTLYNEDLSCKVIAAAPGLVLTPLERAQKVRTFGRWVRFLLPQ